MIRLLTSKSWILCFQNFRTEIAEIDLIFEKAGQVLFIEVKTLDNPWRAFQRIGKKQLSNLQKNFIWFSTRCPSLKFRVFVAWVDENNQVTFVEVS